MLRDGFSPYGWVGLSIPFGTHYTADIWVPLGSTFNKMFACYNNSTAMMSIPVEGKQTNGKWNTKHHSIKFCDLRSEIRLGVSRTFKYSDTSEC